MKRLSLLMVTGLIGLTAWSATADRLAAQQDGGLPEGVEVQLRGPVHEAYAEPTDPQPQAQPVVPRQPPEPIEELPPDQRPEGDDVSWIPGYWAWDEETQDFLWVSGFWRDAPP